MAKKPNTVDFDRVRVHVVDAVSGVDTSRTQIIAKSAYDKEPTAYGLVLEQIPAGQLPNGE